MFGLPRILWVEQTTRYDVELRQTGHIHVSVDVRMIGFGCGCYVTFYTHGSDLPVMCRKHRASGRYT